MFSITNPLSQFNVLNQLIAIITQPLTIIKPNANDSVFYFNSTVPVYLSSNIANTTVYIGPTLFVQCSNSTSVYYNSPINQEFEIDLPVNYVGQCLLYTQAIEIYQASSSNITVTSIKGNVEFYTNTATPVAAGSQIDIVLYSTPFSESFTVQLDCGISKELTVRSTIQSNSSVTQFFSIPSDFNGYCVFSVIEPLAIFFPTNTIQVTVTQAVNISYPSNGSSYLYTTNVPTQVTSFETLKNWPLYFGISCKWPLRGFN